MSAVENFLSIEEEQEVIQAIQEAKRLTSGEIRVHLEPSIDKDVHERALEVFHMLEMGKTSLHNGVLFYIAVETKAFVIYGDKGINKLVSDQFWESTKEIVITHFKKGDFKTGLIKGILEIGMQLKQHFPSTINDNNELFDEISKG
jgi:uncharacterized membrane protein